MNVNRIILRMKIQKKSKAFWLDSLAIEVWNVDSMKASMKFSHEWLIHAKNMFETWNGIQMFKKLVFFYLLRISFHYSHSNTYSHRSNDIKNRFWSMDDFKQHFILQWMRSFISCSKRIHSLSKTRVSQKKRRRRNWHEQTTV